MNPLTQRRTAVIVLLMAALVLAACTRSASTGVVPTATTAPQGVGGGPGPAEPTDAMNALGTALALNITQTAIAGASTGGGDTPQPPPGAAGVTPSPIPTTAPGAATPVPAATTAGSACPNPYTVKQGDWIYKIARECKVQPSVLIAANPGINANFITPGQKLNMPGAGATPAPSTPSATSLACKGTYTVKSGDNLFRIAFNCGFTTEQMAAVNGIKYPYIIYPGQVLKYP
jgi:LysM repeat protein